MKKGLFKKNRIGFLVRLMVIALAMTGLGLTGCSKTEVETTDAILEELENEAYASDLQDDSAADTAQEIENNQDDSAVDTAQEVENNNSADNGKEGIDTSKISEGSQFRNRDRFEEHYEKHVVKQQEFGDITKDEYLALAQQLMDNPGPQVLSKIDEDNNTLFYDPDTNEFGVLSDDGYIRSFFKPSAGQDYYDRQK